MLEARLKQAEALPRDVVRSIVPFDEAGMDHFLGEVDARMGKSRRMDARSVLKNKLIESRFHLALGFEFLEMRNFDLYTYYSKGIDATGHLFWRYFEPEHPAFANKPAPPEEIALFQDVIPNFYAFEDRNLGRLIEKAGPDTYILVVSDHGHHARGHTDAPKGIFLLKGPGVREGQRLETVHIADLTPLLLYLLDLPVAEDMDGRVPLELFTKKHRKDHPLSTIPSYEGADTIAAPETDQAFREDLERELRALGYIQ